MNVMNKVYVLTYEVDTPSNRYSDFISVKSNMDDINDVMSKYIIENELDDYEIDNLIITSYEI
jgi:hypothetical protein